ncbi:MAG TPA: T9SS type A sorting domain-containing protein [Bacteroidia bacterium]|nr:T9SS type A sorting domain-containing protein [Bacteroidia bacterium]
MKYFVFLMLFFSISAYSQMDLRKNKPDLPDSVWKIKQYKRINDLKQRRSAAGHPNMDWARWQEWEKINQAQNKTTQISTWENLGPHTKSGRIISIAFHPTDTNIMYAGSASGGLWKTANYGATWIPITDNYPTMGVGAVAINPQNPSSIIIATGEGYAFGSEFTSGFGILISHDDGQSWSLTNITAGLGDSFAGMDIMWNSNDTSKVCVATSFGIYFSNDGGLTYSYVLDRMPSRIVQDPQNPANLYLAARYYSAMYPGGFYKSFNSGQTWSLVTGSGLPALTDMGYASLAVHPVYNNIIFANISQSSVNGLGPMEGLYKSDDFGTTFTQIPTNVDIHCYHPPYQNICQGWYDNTIVISPNDTNVLIAGGTRFWKSIDGGYIWTNCDLDSTATAYTVHPDHHQTLFHPLTGHLFDCNDGGINYSGNEGVTWTSISDGLITHQFYSIAFAETDSEVVIGGAQDVGLFSSTQSLSVAAWENEFSGDAFGCTIDHQDEDTWYATVYLNYRRIKSNNSGLNWSQVNSGTSAADQWRMPMVMHPNDNQTLLSSNDDFMYKTINGGATWQTMATTGSIGCFEYDKINPDLIYASELFGGTVYRTVNGGNIWFQLANSPGFPVTDLAADPQNTGVVYASVGSFATQDQVFKSVNSGITWTNISANLPAVPAITLTVDPWDNLTLYAGTDLGVWVTQDGGISWTPFNNGLPAVVVEDIHFYKPDTTIRIGTYGRGYWRTKALPSGSVSIQEQSVSNFMNVYPNPLTTESKLTFRNNKKDEYLFTLYDITGRVTESVTTKSNQIILTKDNKQPGVYLFNLINEKTGERWNGKIVIAK